MQVPRRNDVTAADFKYARERIATLPTIEISYHLAAIKGYDAMLEGMLPTRG